MAILQLIRIDGETVLEVTPEPIIKDGKIINHEELKRFYQDKYLKDCRIKRGIFMDIPEPRPEPQPDIIYTGLTPKDWNEFNQLKARMNALDTKILQLLSKKKEEGKPF